MTIDKVFDLTPGIDHEAEAKFLLVHLTVEQDAEHPLGCRNFTVWFRGAKVGRIKNDDRYALNLWFASASEKFQHTVKDHIITGDFESKEDALLFIAIQLAKKMDYYRAYD